MLPESRACGFVLWRTDGVEKRYLVLVNRERGEAGLPKGHAEPGESDLDTARRETEEETGLRREDLDVEDGFRRELRYEAERRGRRFDKTVVYFLAEARGEGEVRLSPEHSAFAWLPYRDALARLPFDTLRSVLREAALYLKDSALFALEPAREADADAHLRSLPHADDGLVGHLRGGARLARRFAEALREAEEPCDVEAAAAGTLLHDVGRALGEHADHQRAGLEHLRKTPLAAYGFACVSHFTKGAPIEDLRAVGIPEPTLSAFRRLIDTRRMTWEERCAALADACMKGTEPTSPRERFEDLRRRYGAGALIDLQERRTDAIRREIQEWIGRDPLSLVGLTR
jgi:bis(5'-nucleosidyl)-tetraphosphatase